jgi:LuxR family maltose regulon positive regulatory protein
VLRYLPTNLSAREIGRELSVSLNTVRTHSRHIFAKLGVHRRTEAATRALGLLAPSPARPEVSAFSTPAQLVMHRPPGSPSTTP